MDALTKYVQSMIGQPFAWGKNDCLTFAQETVKIQIGECIYDNWYGGYHSEFGAAKHYKTMTQRSDFDGILEAISDRFSQILTLYPTHGMLVARPFATGPLGSSFGVCVGNQLALMSLEGVAFVDPQAHDIYWDVK